MHQEGKAGAESFDTYSYQGLLTNGRALQVKQLLFGIYESSKVEEDNADTMYDIWSLVMWSFWFAFLGCVADTPAR